MLHASDALLDGLLVAVAGRARALHVAARCLRDLGARVVATAPPSEGAVDRLWLGELDAPPPGPLSVHLALLDEDAESRLRADTVVRYRAVASPAERSGERLDEPMLAAVGGAAIAIGEPGRPALPLPEGCLDALIGTHLAAAGLAALLDFTSETEVAGADAVAWAVATNLHLYLPYGLPWMRSGRRASGSGSCYPYSIFDAADGPYCLIGRSERDWDALIDAMGRPAWAADPSFADPRIVGREYPERADAHVGPWVAGHTRAELSRLLVERRFPCAPVLEPEEVVGLDYVRDRLRTAWHEDRRILVPGPVHETAAAGAAAAARPFSDLVVLDLSWVWSGPAVSTALAELGATVIKVESAARPDGSRLRGAPRGVHVAADDPARLDLVPYFHGLNRGKLSVSLDLKTDEGRAILQRLAQRADVIVENLSAGVMDRWGIAPDAVHAGNPGCVFVSMRGYRDHPSVAGLRAYAPALSSASGIEALVRYPGEPPTGAMTIAFADAMAAAQGLLCSLAGLRARMVRGHGSAIALSQFEAAIFANGRNIVAAQIGGAPAIEPLEDERAVIGADRLTRSPWVSPDLFGTVEPSGLPPVTVARLPWRRDGRFAALGAAGPKLGADTDRIVRGLARTGGTGWITA